MWLMLRHADCILAQERWTDGMETSTSRKGCARPGQRPMAIALKGLRWNCLVSRASATEPEQRPRPGLARCRPRLRLDERSGARRRLSQTLGAARREAGPARQV